MRITARVCINCGTPAEPVEQTFLGVCALGGKVSDSYRQHPGVGPSITYGTSRAADSAYKDAKPRTVSDDIHIKARLVTAERASAMNVAQKEPSTSGPQIRYAPTPPGGGIGVHVALWLLIGVGTWVMRSNDLQVQINWFSPPGSSSSASPPDIPSPQRVTHTWVAQHTSYPRSSTLKVAAQPRALRNTDPGLVTVLLDLSAKGEWDTVRKRVSNERPAHSVKGNRKLAKHHDQLGLRCYARSDYLAALVEFEKAVAFYPGDPEIRNHLAAAELRMGNEERAMAHLRDAFKLDLRHAATWLTYAEVLAETGKRSAALAALKLVVYFAHDQERTIEVLSGDAVMSSEPLKEVLEGNWLEITAVPRHLT